MEKNLMDKLILKWQDNMSVSRGYVYHHRPQKVGKQVPW